MLASIFGFLDSVSTVEFNVHGSIVEKSESRTERAALGAETLVIAPTYNERHNLEGFLNEVFQAAPQAHVLVVDDHSPDGTGELADELALNEPRLFVYHRPGKLGLGTAYVEGFRWGLQRNYQRFFEMDADGSHKAEHLAAFFAALDRGAELVLGSRNIPGGSIVGWGPFRHFLSRGGSLYARTILGVAIRDLTSGFKAFTRECLEDLELSTVSSTGYSFQIELTYRALLRKRKVVEVPICFEDRLVGQSKMSRDIFAEAVVAVWRFRIKKPF